MGKFIRMMEDLSNESYKKVVAVAAADEASAIAAVVKAAKEKLCTFLLFGDEGKIRSLLEGASEEELKMLKIIHTSNEERSIQLAVQSVIQNEAQLIMKGNIETAPLLREVLKKEQGLLTGNLLSNVAMFDMPSFDGPILLTDAALSITPTLKDKVHIIKNAVYVAHKIGLSCPKVALLAPIEKINPAIESTMDAAILTQMNRRSQIEGCIVDGPLALDNAISLASATKKNIDSEVAGRADILVTPDLDAGNILYKSLVFFANASVGSVVVGAKVPIILSSRADSSDNKLHSIALALTVVK